MKKNQNKKSFILSALAIMMALSLCLSLATPNVAEAAGKKKGVQSVTLTAAGQQANGRTVTVGKGAKMKIGVTVNPGGAKKSVSYSSSNKKVATVTKGRISAKKPGTAKITVRVKGKNGKVKKVWLRVKVAGKGSSAGKGCKHNWKPYKVQNYKLVPCDEYTCIHCFQSFPLTAKDDGTLKEHARLAGLGTSLTEYLGLGTDYMNYFFICDEQIPTGTYHIDYYYCTKCGARKNP